MVTKLLGLYNQYSEMPITASSIGQHLEVLNDISSQDLADYEGIPISLYDMLMHVDDLTCAEEYTQYLRAVAACLKQCTACTEEMKAVYFMLNYMLVYAMYTNTSKELYYKLKGYCVLCFDPKKLEVI